MNKIRLLIRTCQEIKNWYIVPLVYFGLLNNEYFILNFRNGLQCKLSTKSTDIHAFANVWLSKEYENRRLDRNHIEMKTGKSIMEIIKSGDEINTNLLTWSEKPIYYKIQEEKANKELGYGEDEEYEGTYILVDGEEKPEHDEDGVSIDY